MTNIEGYTKYCGNGTLKQTEDFNDCYVIQIDNLQGAENLIEDMTFEEYTVPNLDGMTEEDFPLVIWFNDLQQEWCPLFADDVKGMETAIKIFKKI